MAGRERLRRDWPFRRLGIVLSGGGSLGAYEVGVFRALERIGLKPWVVAGVSIGAVNAVAWSAHGFRTEALERVWTGLRPSSIGMRWLTLAARALGAFLIAVGLFEVALTLLGAPILDVVLGPEQPEASAWLLDATVWIVVTVVGLALAIGARRVEELLGHTAPPADFDRFRRRFGIGLLVAAVALAAVSVLGVPWPRRAHATLLVVGTVVWLLAGRSWSDRLRDLTLRLLPETRGRGLWRSGARRRLVDRLVAHGDHRGLGPDTTRLILTACALDTGRMAYFINWRDVDGSFAEGLKKVAGDIGDVIELDGPDEVVAAAVASSAVPVLFEPARFRGREYLDAGVFTNQPVQAVVAAGADALLLVLVSPSGGPRTTEGRESLVELGARIQEIATWRDLAIQLRLLPPEFTRTGPLPNVCVVEPDAPLEGSLLIFEPPTAERLIAQGERDALRALARAGWTAGDEATPAAAS